MTTVKNPMSKLQIVEMQHDLRKERLEGCKRDVENLQGFLTRAIERGHYNEAAQWAEKITENAYQIDAMSKELQEVDSYLKFLKEDDCLRTPKNREA